MRIFVMPALYPCEDNRQMGIYVYEQCEVLKKHGHELVILDCSSRNYKKWSECNKQFKYTDDNGEVYVNRVRGIAQSRLPRLAVRAYMKNVEKIFKKALKEHGKPDVIYAHFTFPCGYAARYLSKKYQIPYAVQEHYSLFLNDNLPAYLKDITKKTVESSAAYFCVSQRLKESIEQLTGIKDKIGVVNNLINDRYRYYPLETCDKFVFFAAGNLVKSKKFDLLIEAFSNAFSDQAPVELRIAGNGKEYEALSLMIKEKDNIVMLGRLNTKQMIDEYKKCNCFVLLSEYETFGIVYREAMAVGRPVIAVKNGGIEENWDDAFGILIDKNNPEQSIMALKRIKENYSNYNLKEISDATLKLYSGENIYQLIKNQFKNIKQEVIISW